MNEKPKLDLSPSRFETSREMLLAGLIERYNIKSHEGIGDQWGQFASTATQIGDRVGSDSFGASFNRDAKGNFDYLTGVEVISSSKLPAAIKTLRIAAPSYAVFIHTGHVEAIKGTFDAIWSWCKKSGRKCSDAPLFERYGPQFDPKTGAGGLEIWIPVEPQDSNRQ